MNVLSLETRKKVLKVFQGVSWRATEEQGYAEKIQLLLDRLAGKARPSGVSQEYLEHKDKKNDCFLPLITLNNCDPNCAVILYFTQYFLYFVLRGF